MIIHSVINAIIQLELLGFNESLNLLRIQAILRSSPVIILFSVCLLMFKISRSVVPCIGFVYATTFSHVHVEAVRRPDPTITYWRHHAILVKTITFLRWIRLTQCRCVSLENSKFLIPIQHPVADLLYADKN